MAISDTKLRSIYGKPYSGPAEITDSEKFKAQLKVHQQGKTDYFTFCKDCAETGIEKWIVDLNKMTCVYYDKYGNEILVEEIPS